MVEELWGGWGRWSGSPEGTGAGRKGKLLENLGATGAGGRGRYLIGFDNNGAGKKVLGRVEETDEWIGRIWGWRVGETVG